MYGKGVVLFEINCSVQPYMPKHLFLCMDFIESRLVNSDKQMPVLRRIHLKKKRKSYNWS